MHVCLIPDEGERVRPKTKPEQLSELMYLNKDADADADMSAYDRLLNTMKKLDASYNPMMQNIYKPVIDINYKVTRYTRVIPIMEREDEKSSGFAVHLFLWTLENLRPSRKQ